MRKYFQANLWIVWCLLFVLNLFLYFGLTDKSYHENSLIFSKFRIFWRIFAKILLLFFKLLYFSRNFRFFAQFLFFPKFTHFFCQIFALFFAFFAKCSHYFLRIFQITFFAKVSKNRLKQNFAKKHKFSHFSWANKMKKLSGIKKISGKNFSFSWKPNLRSILEGQEAIGTPHTSKH